LDAKQLTDGNILAALQSSSTDGDLEGLPLKSGLAWLIKFDTNMEIIWQQFYGALTCPFTPFKITELLTGDLVFAGYPGEGCEGHHGQTDIGIMKTDAEGNVLWIRNYGSPGAEWLEGFLPTQDGGFLITAHSSGVGGDIPIHYGDGMSDDAVIIKTDSTGEIQWVKVFGGSADDGPLADIVECSQGYYIINLGSFSDNYDLAGSGISGHKRVIIKLDSLGNEVARNIISGSSDLRAIAGRQILHYDNKLIHAASSNPNTSLFPGTVGFGGAGYDGAIATFDTALNFTDMKVFGGTKFDYLYRITLGDDGNFYLLGTSFSQDNNLPANYNNASTSDYWLMSVDSNFNLLWSRNFGGSHPNGELGGGSFKGNLIQRGNYIYVFVRNMVPASLPDYDIACGHLNPIPPIGSPNADAWLVAFDLSTIKELPAPEPMPTGISIYINPETQQLVIVNPDTAVQDYRVSVSDMLGRKVVIANYTTPFTTFQIPTAQWAKGLYIVALSKGGQAVYTDKIMMMH
jgi:hypothetical protein